MTQQIINIGTQPNDRSGDPLRVAFQKVNSNFTELYQNVEYISIDGGDATAVYSPSNLNINGGGA
jgi:hypothetical protein